MSSTTLTRSVGIPGTIRPRTSAFFGVRVDLMRQGQEINEFWDPAVVG
jgi:hypothetical protein